MEQSPDTIRKNGRLAGGTAGDSSFRLFVKFFRKRTTAIRALKVAAVITPILTIVNHFHEILALSIGPRFWLQVGLTFCIPYCVSSYSSAMQALADHRKHQAVD